MWRLILTGLLICSVNYINAQTDTSWALQNLADIPQHITNNAVVGIKLNGNQYAYSFGGIQDGLTFNRITRKCFRYNLNLNIWDTIAPLPDTLGKIASAASLVKGKIYILGGYHVFANADEVSSDKVHVFNPATNNYETDGSPIPLPIDDHVQGVWRDSLIYVITGWSNTGNVPNVQIYNPSTDTWSAGTPVPPSNNEVFGGSGVIIDDTIYYLGGARSGFNYPISSDLRIGVIQPNQPDSITWTSHNVFGAAGYRMGALAWNGKPVWIGGGNNTYNYNAASYNGMGVVEPQNRILVYNPATDSMTIINGKFAPVMDFRGVADMGDGNYLTIGGIGQNAEVLQKVYLLSNALPIGIWENEVIGEIKLYPNPTTGTVILNLIQDLRGTTAFELYDLLGKQVYSQSITNTKTTITLNLPEGVYIYQVVVDGLVVSNNKLVIVR